MGFVTGLPISTDEKGESNDSILVIIDYLTKMLYYVPVKVMINILGLAKVITNMVIHLHGIPKLIITNQGLVFVSKS